MATQQQQQQDDKTLLSSYLRLSFSLFLFSLPSSSLAVVSSLQAENSELRARLVAAEDQIREMKCRRKEDSKANARVVEIFASHRNSWQLEERKLLGKIDASGGEVERLRAKIEALDRDAAELRARVEDLRREVSERDEMINFMSRRTQYGSGDGDGFDDDDDDGVAGSGEELTGGSGGEEFYADSSRFRNIRVTENECFFDGDPNADEIGGLYARDHPSEFNSGDLLASASKFWTERANLWQDVQYESHESLYPMKQYVARRESPWKVDGESAGVSFKLKSLEQEVANLENLGKGDDTLKLPLLMRKQTKRYQALAGKIDELCRRMASDHGEGSLTPELRTQRQTEFLLEAFRLEHRATETGEKLRALQKNGPKDDYGTRERRSLESVRNNLKEIQRNLEIWIARIIGDLEGILARDGAASRSHVTGQEKLLSRGPQRGITAGFNKGSPFVRDTAQDRLAEAPPGMACSLSTSKHGLFSDAAGSSSAA